MAPLPWRLMRTDSSPSWISISDDVGLLQQLDQLLYLADVHCQWFSFGWSWRQATERGAQRQRVSLGPESADHAHRDIGEVGVGAEGLAGVHVRQVHLDEGNRHRQQGVAQGDAGVGEGGRIDDDETYIVARGPMDGLDQHMFRVALDELEAMAVRHARSLQARAGYPPR